MNGDFIFFTIVGIRRAFIFNENIDSRIRDQQLDIAIMRIKGYVLGVLVAQIAREEGSRRG